MEYGILIRLVGVINLILILSWMKFSLLRQPVGLFKLMLNWFYTSNIQRRELCWCDLMKSTFKIVIRDTGELICFNVDMTLNTSSLFSLIPVWMTLMFTQGGSVMGKVELVQSFCCKVAWSNSDVHDDYVGKVTVKKSCKWGIWIV